MSILDRMRPAAGQGPLVVPPEIDGRIVRGRATMKQGQLERTLFQKFFEGDHYWYLNSAGELRQQSNGMVGVASPSKPSYRIRNRYPWISAVVEAKVSASTQRVPGYEITPSTDDSDDMAAARLAQQVAAYLYDEVRVRRATTKAVTNALVQREGFVMPYFDQSVGPYETDPVTGEQRGVGQIRLMNLCRSEVMWEPGVDFEDSRWHAIERMRLKEEVAEIPGYLPGTLQTPAEQRTGESHSQWVLITEYLERPSTKYPKGRRGFLADGQVCVDHRQDPDCEPGWTDWWEPYPYLDADGVVQDDPVIHRISYTVNPDDKKGDLGLVERIIDLQRTVDDCWNKILELKNRALMLQILAPYGAEMQRRDDNPGSVLYYKGPNAPSYEPAPDPGYLSQLRQIMQDAIQQLRDLAADIDVQADPRLSAGTVNAAVQNNQNRWQAFLGDLAEFHSRLMRHMLVLVARYYTQDRQIQIRGQYGWMPLESFNGQDMRSQVNVRVLAGTLEARSRQAIQQEISWVQTNWPGAISPEAALSAIHGGSYDGLLRSYENDVAKAWRIIRRLRTGPQAINSFGDRFEQNTPDLSHGVDPLTGQFPLGAQVPNWMPAPQDNIQIWRTVIGDYMKTEDYEHQLPEVQNNFRLIWDGLTAAEQMRAAEQAAQQQMQAQSLGMSNAAKQQTPPPLPDRAGFTPENSSPAAAPASPAPPQQS